MADNKAWVEPQFPVQSMIPSYAHHITETAVFLISLKVWSCLQRHSTHQFVHSDFSRGWAFSSGV